jgi:hypothetical protein
MLLTSDAALEGCLDGALEAGGGGEGESSTLLRLLVCLEVEECVDLALDLLE